MIPYSRQDISEDDIRAVVDILRSDMITQGKTTGEFETSLATMVKAKHAIVMASATAVLHTSCLALGIKPGDRVWTSPISFVASANGARYAGAIIDFVDVDPLTGNMDIGALAEKLDQAEKSGTLPKLVIPVHFAGRAINMIKLAALAKHYQFQIIEDAAHALGAQYPDGTAIGNGQYSDITVFSFHAVKPVTTGEGGAALTNKKNLADHLTMLRSHGITRDAERLETQNEGAWYYEMQLLGYHYRMTDFQAALGKNQLQRLTHFIDRRRAIATRYHQLLADLPLLLPPPDAGCGWHLYAVQLDPTRTRKTRREIFEGLRAAGIGVNVHYIPIHLQPYYRQLGFTPGMFPRAETFYQQELSLPIHQQLTDAEQDQIIQRLRELLA